MRVIWVVAATVLLACEGKAPVQGCDGSPEHCWAVNVKYTVNEAVGGQPAYVTHDLYPQGQIYAERADAEGVAAKIAVTGVLLHTENPEPAFGYFVPPSRIDAVTIQDVLQ